MRHLLAISVGPVQEFIAAARRTRDLWFGSHLLSEISRAVAQSVETAGGTLVFPEASDADSIANVIVAVLPSADPATVAVEAKKAANRRWQKFAEDAKGRVTAVIRDEVWNEQVDDVIEFYAAWAPYDGNNYQQTRARVMRLLAGRKNCRDFVPANGRAGVPKSSLDGLRETVFVNSLAEGGDENAQQRLRVRAGEQLDVVGVVKRVGQGSKPYPSVARVAADPWIRGNKHKEPFAELTELVKGLKQKSSDAVHRLDTSQYPQFKDFPFEGTAVYPSRFHEWIEETKLTQEDLKPLRDTLKKLPDADPYLAVLVADGDRMGATISQLRDVNTNRAFSRELASFAGRAKDILQDHHGVLVYAGGDDVLAFVPVDRCLDCARALYDAFGAIWTMFFAQYRLQGDRPTLSVGIAIAHFLENLEDLLDYGRAAEKDAKQPNRNALAVHLHKRSGAPVRVRRNWADSPDQRLTEQAELIVQQAIPGGLPYELRRLVELYSGWPAETEADNRRRLDALQQDTIRVIRDKQPKAGKAYMRRIKDLIEAMPSIDDFRQFARELLVARQIAAALKQAGAKPTKRMEECGS